MRHPLFIVGSPRSGTSVLVNVVSRIGYKGFSEGNFLSLLTGIDVLIERHYQNFTIDDKNVLIANVDKDGLKRRLFAVLRGTVSALNPLEPWFDKTGNPEMILATPILKELWPSAVFIFAKRRGIENLISRIRKFPNYPFEYHCADWARNMSSWRGIREHLGSDRFLEIDQWNMIHNPETVAKSLCGFLAVDEAMIPTATDVLKTQRPQETTRGSACRTCSLSATGWTAAKIQIFLKHCKPEMDAYGYTLHEQSGIVPNP